MTDQKTILLIDDEVDFVKMLKGVLESEGYCVAVAHNGFEGLKRLRTINPHLIILDMNMPKMGGIEMLRKLRNDSKGRDIPVIMFTNLGDNENVANAIELGSNDYLVKSNWTLENIMAKIKEKLEV